MLGPRSSRNSSLMVACLRPFCYQIGYKDAQTSLENWCMSKRSAQASEFWDGIIPENDLGTLQTLLTVVALLIDEQKLPRAPAEPLM